MMKVAEVDSLNTSTYSHLGLKTLYEIATLPTEEREKLHIVPSAGESKTVDDMTVKELLAPSENITGFNPK